jgi:hypothetical protein
MSDSTALRRHDASARGSEAHPTSVTVRLVGVPTELFLRSRQRTDDLVRELWLMALSDENGPRGRYYRQLVLAADAYSRRGAAVRQQVMTEVLAAQERGEATTDLAIDLPPEAVETALQWEQLLEEMDALCTRGELLTLASPPELARFHRWYSSEVVHQLRDGSEPVPFTSA